MDGRNDEVYLTKGCKQWPVKLAEKLLASPLPWGPPTYALGIGYVDDPKQPDQSDDFLKLASCVKEAYERHGGSMGNAWGWVNPIIKKMEEGDSCGEYSTQDLLDIVFLHMRGEHFTDGLTRAAEPHLREIVQEVVRRVHSSHPPIFREQNS